jgi:hypothetical protein
MRPEWGAEPLVDDFEQRVLGRERPARATITVRQAPPAGPPAETSNACHHLARVRPLGVGHEQEQLPRLEIEQGLCGSDR